MAENTITIDASPEEVFDVLLHARSYGDWVMGCKDVRDVDAHWPQPGSRLHHTVGMGPLNLQDTTGIVSVDRPRRLVLEARARPAGIAHVSFTLEPSGPGTKVAMIEHPVRGPARRLNNPVLDAMVRSRNAETLRRLKRLVEKEGLTRPPLTWP